MRTSTPAVSNRPRHPREVRERMEGEVMILITGADALLRLTHDCRFPEAKARRLLNIAWEFGQKAEPCPGGYVHIWYHGKDDTDNHVFSVVEHIGKKQPEKVARRNDPRYTQSRNETPSRDTGKAEPASTTKGKTMPPKRNRSRQADPEPETASQNGEVDFQKYVQKPFSPTMTDYVEWFEQNVASLDELEVDRILVLGVTMYSHFQKSDFNIQRREARRADREQTRATDEDEEAPEPQTRTRGRAKSAKPAPAATARSGARSGRAANGKAASPSKPARRTRATAGAASGGDAPF
jgi:hypothetical protein